MEAMLATADRQEVWGRETVPDVWGILRILVLSMRHCVEIIRMIELGLFWPGKRCLGSPAWDVDLWRVSFDATWPRDHMGVFRTRLWGRRRHGGAGLLQQGCVSVRLLDWESDPCLM